MTNPSLYEVVSSAYSFTSDIKRYDLINMPLTQCFINQKRFFVKLIYASSGIHRAVFEGALSF